MSMTADLHLTTNDMKGTKTSRYDKTPSPFGWLSLGPVTLFTPHKQDLERLTYGELLEFLEEVGEFMNFVAELWHQANDGKEKE